MSEPTPQQHWGLWMRLHEPVRMPFMDRLRIHLWANIRMLGRPGVLLLSSAVAVLPSGVFCVAMLLALDGIGSRRLGTTASLLALGGAVAVWLAVQHLFFVYSMQRWYAPFVRREFARRGVPMCDRCGHRLPPSTPEACPECGGTVPRVQESKPVSG